MATDTLPIVHEARSDALARQTKWVQDRDALLDQFSGLAAVESDAALDLAGALLADGKKHLRALEKARKEATDPLDQIKKALMAQERELGNPLLAEIDRTQRLADEYATAKARAAEEARRAAERAAAEAAAKAAADDEARRAKAADVFGEAAAEQVAIPDVSAVVPVSLPPPPPPRAEGSRMVTRWSFQVVDPAKVPREFFTVDETKIRAWMNYQVKLGNQAPTLPGVAFTSTVSVEASGRR